MAAIQTKELAQIAYETFMTNWLTGKNFVRWIELQPEYRSAWRKAINEACPGYIEMRDYLIEQEVISEVPVESIFIWSDSGEPL